MKKNKYTFASASALNNRQLPVLLNLENFFNSSSKFSSKLLRLDAFIKANPHGVAFLIGVFIFVSFLLRL